MSYLTVDQIRVVNGFRGQMRQRVERALLVWNRMEFDHEEAKRKGN